MALELVEAAAAAAVRCFPEVPVGDYGDGVGRPFPSPEPLTVLTGTQAPRQGQPPALGFLCMPCAGKGALGGR